MAETTSAARCAKCGGPLTAGWVELGASQVCGECVARVFCTQVPSSVPRAALEDALEGLEEMLPYVPDYFVTKWHLTEYAERAREALK